MNAEQLVCSLENAKKLHELGVRVESYFSWYSSDEGPFIADTDVSMDSMLGIVCICPAYTASELGEMLPEEMDGYQITMTYAQGVWVAFYEDPQGAQWNDIYECDPNLQDALCKLATRLIEDGHINVEEINERQA